MTSTAKRAVPPSSRRRLGAWITENEDAIAEFRASLVRKARQRGTTQPLSPAVSRLRACVIDDPVRRMDLSLAIAQAQDEGHRLGFGDIDTLMTTIDYVTTTAPAFDKASLIVCPLNALLDWLMCVPSGYAFFCDPELNRCLRDVLTQWCHFLSGPDSRTFLNRRAPDGWLSDEADARLNLDEFEMDRDLPYGGFDSWNAFFTRRFRPGMRPVASPDDPWIIVNACESTPYNVQHHAHMRDTFWIKSQPYSLLDMFGASHKALAAPFAGGTVYQAYLSAYDYHRWHAPVDGTVIAAYRLPGTYYSEAPSEGEDQAGLNDSQGYLTATATRAIVVIKAEEPALGTVGCLFVGMGDVSSCILRVDRGQHLGKGDELGYFQYGGSTYCLVFEEGVIASLAPDEHSLPGDKPLKVNAALARAR
ncbi:phosphatidylserine decarboxylase family protein [Pandoraea pulmonicola]|uniref:Phosphatidylserine decarboxylase n=1 Tax=Pandoraea pulmonicola TaxID=93221 RepID=A0AAJ4ZHI3_PANPU|nr:phosphatidylserine decarboxylase family protein [Pandoraea pulmonicola]AJC22415.1 phosphatidylserine decarboxylase [Pandoraea pulmonicola]SUA93464.1 phosphatidylserine decarboxylase [Pandoraea pulmonicola]